MCLQNFTVNRVLALGTIELLPALYTPVYNVHLKVYSVAQWYSTHFVFLLSCDLSGILRLKLSQYVSLSVSTNNP